MAKKSTKNNNNKQIPQSSTSITKHKKKGKGRNYYASVNDNNGTIKKSSGDKKKFERKEPKLYKEGEVWSKAKKKKMRRLNAKQTAGVGRKRSDIDGITDVKSIKEQLPKKKKKKHKGKGEKEKNINPLTPPEKNTFDNVTETKKESKHANLFGGSKAPSTMSDLQKSFLDRLSGSRFRILNEVSFEPRKISALSYPISERHVVFFEIF